jgi:flagellar basal body-associated protein FliL
MAEEKSKTKSNALWIVISVVLLVAVIVLGYMLYSEKFTADKEALTTTKDSVVIPTLDDAKLGVLIADSAVEDMNDNVDLSEEDLSLSL